MSTRYLESLFNPSSIVVIGASERADNLGGMVLMSQVPRWLAMLIDAAEEQATPPPNRSMMGGIDLAWSEADEAGDWGSALLPMFESTQQRAEFLDELGIEPDLESGDEPDDDDEDEDQDTKLDQWLSDNEGEVSEAITGNARGFFDEAEVAEKMLSAECVQEYADLGVHLVRVATFKIESGNW